MWASDQVDDSRAVTVHRSSFIPSAGSSKSSPSLSLPHSPTDNFIDRLPFPALIWGKQNMWKQTNKTLLGLTGKINSSPQMAFFYDRLISITWGCQSGDSKWRINYFFNIQTKQDWIINPWEILSSMKKNNKNVWVFFFSISSCQLWLLSLSWGNMFLKLAATWPALSMSCFKIIFSALMTGFSISVLCVCLCICPLCVCLVNVIKYYKCPLQYKLDVSTPSNTARYNPPAHIMVVNTQTF